MSTISDKLQQILNCKSNIKDAIIAKGVEVSSSTPLADYPEKISQISGGVTPTGTVNITNNGTVDVTDYATANVDVPSAPIYRLPQSETEGYTGSIEDENMCHLFDYITVSPYEDGSGNNSVNYVFDNEITLSTDSTLTLYVRLNLLYSSSSDLGFMSFTNADKTNYLWLDTYQNKVRIITNYNGTQTQFKTNYISNLFGYRLIDFKLVFTQTGFTLYYKYATATDYSTGVTGSYNFSTMPIDRIDFGRRKGYGSYSAPVAFDLRHCYLELDGERIMSGIIEEEL